MLNDLNDSVGSNRAEDRAMTGAGNGRKRGEPSTRERVGPQDIERFVAGLLHARVVDPGQVPMYHHGRYDSPEMSLVRSVLEDAIRSVLRGGSTTARRREVAEDLAWFASEDDGHAFTFVTVCQRLQLDPSWIRRLVRTRAARRPALQAEAA
jgi:hypothetical protein